MVNNHELLQVNEAKGKIDEFFSEQQDLADECYSLLRYISAIDPEIVLRFNEDIIGASKPNSVFHFYISFDGNKYYIKFKNSKQKIIFNPELKDSYELKCQQVVKLIKENPMYKLDSQLSKRDKEADWEEIIPVFITECDEALEKCRECFKQHSNYQITSDVFGVRATSVMKRACIMTLCDLLNYEAADLFKIRNIGRKSIEEFTSGCHQLYEVFEGESPSDNPNRSDGNKQAHNAGWKPLHHKINQIIEIYNDDSGSSIKLERMSNFYKEVESFFVYCILDGPFLTERQGKILYKRYFERRTFKSIADEYNVTAERIRQICKRSERKVVYRLRRGAQKYPVISEFASKIEKINDLVFLEYMVYVKRNNQFLWNCLSSLIIDKDSRSQLQYLVDTYDREISGYMLEPICNESIYDRNHYREQSEDGNDPLINGSTRIKPSRAGEPWTDEEDLRLKEEFDNGMKQSQIAKEHERTNGAIRARLKKQGLIID